MNQNRPHVPIPSRPCRARHSLAVEPPLPRRAECYPWQLGREGKARGGGGLLVTAHTVAEAGAAVRVRDLGECPRLDTPAVGTATEYVLTCDLFKSAGFDLFVSIFTLSVVCFCDTVNGIGTYAAFSTPHFALGSAIKQDSNLASIQKNGEDAVSSGSIARIPLNTFAISLGVAGLAELWANATAVLDLPSIVGEIGWVVAGIVWVWMIIAHTVRGAKSPDPLQGQLRHPVQGPIASLIPIVGMLLGANLYPYWAVGGTVLIVVSLVGVTLFAAWILASWMSSRLELNSIHGGYFLPTVAGGYVASYALATIGTEPLALAFFVAASFFWVILFTLLFARLAFRPSLPDPLVPTMAIMMAPPAVAAAAWFEINGGLPDPVETSLAGLTVIMVLIQLAFLPKYVRLKFSLGFWSFTFPTANVATQAIIWLGIQRPAGWQVVVVAIVVAVTALIVAIAVKSLILRSDDRKAHRSTAESQLNRADQAVTVAG